MSPETERDGMANIEYAQGKIDDEIRSVLDFFEVTTHHSSTNRLHSRLVEVVTEWYRRGQRS